MKRLEELTATETMMALFQIDDNVRWLREASPSTNYFTLRHYIGPNYDRHVEHLERIGFDTSYFRRLRREW
jgi:hypothetical protein